MTAALRTIFLTPSQPVRNVLDDIAVPHNVEKLQVYQNAIDAAGEISAIIRRPSFDHDRRLREQLGSSSERVASLISEGSEQSTDRHFSEYCYRSKGSARETRTQLIVAVQRAHITAAEREALDKRYQEIGRMLAGLIDRLEREDWKRARKK